MTIKQQGGIFGRNPTFNDVNVDGSFNVNNNNLYVDNNTVGIGNNSPASLISGGDGSILSIGGFDYVLTNDEKTGTISFITADGSYTGTYPDGIAAEIACVAETFTGAGYGLAFYTGIITDGDRAERLRISRTGDVELKTGNLIVPSGKGIDFSATSGTGTSELFDDYEEGSWSPVISDATSGGNTGTATVSYATYTKVGNLVHLKARLLNLNTTGMGSGNIYVQGVPFVADGDGEGVATTSHFTASANALGITPSIDNNASHIKLKEIISGGVYINADSSQFNSGTADLWITITYHT